MFRNKFPALAFLLFTIALCASPPALSDPFQYSATALLSSGRPAAGAMVHFYSLAGTDAKPTAEAEAAAKKNGSFLIDLPDAALENGQNYYTLLITCGDEAAYLDVSDPDDRPAAIRLSPTVSIRVRAVDEHNRPAAGLAIAVSSIQIAPDSKFVNWGKKTGAPWKALTNNLGGAVIEKIPLGSRVKLDVDSSQYEAAGDTDIFDASGKASVRTILVAPLASVSGKVTYQDSGEAAAGAPVYMTQENGAKSYTAFTDEKGNYTFPEVEKGKYFITPEFYGPASEEWTAVPKRNVEAQAGKPLAGIDIELIRGAVIKGKASYKKTGDAAENLQILVYADHDYSSPVGAASIHSDGSYTLHAPPGDIHLTASLGDAQSGDKYECDLNLKEGETKTLDFTVDSPLPAWIFQGRITDASGAPIPDATLVLFAKTGPPQVGQSDSYGAFKINSASDGDFLICYSKTLQMSAPVALNYKINNTNLILDSPLIRASGIVTDSKGNPVSGANVTLRIRPFGSGGDEQISAKSETDSNGKYSIGPVFLGMNYVIDASKDGAAQNAPFTLKTNNQAGDIPAIQLPK